MYLLVEAILMFVNDLSKDISMLRFLNPFGVSGQEDFLELKPSSSSNTDINGMGGLNEL